MNIETGWLAFVAAAIGMIVWLRWDAKRDAARDAAQKQEETRHEADAAARVAERDGAAERLRNGQF